MEMYEVINLKIKEAGLTKREFIAKLLSLEPKLKSTGEIPLETTIYKYLNGTIDIKTELISYIAEALNIPEQELFINTSNDRKVFFSKMINVATDEEIEFIKNKLLSKIELQELLQSYDSLNKQTNNDNNKVDQIINLLAYAPEPLIDSLLYKLKDIKEYTKNI